MLSTMARRKGDKYKSAQVVAEMGLQNLLKQIPTMIDDYAQAMKRIANDEEAQARYVNGVTQWTIVMRSPDVRESIATAVGRAKTKYKTMREGYQGAMTVGSTVPVTVPAR